MREIVRTDDRILLTYIGSLLRGAGIEPAVFDTHANALQGAAGLAPCRIAVPDEDWREARRILEEAGLGKWILAPEDGHDKQ